MSKRSLQAYLDILPTLNAKETSILITLQRGDFTAELISQMTKINLITTRARLSELYDKGLVAQYDDGKYYLVHHEDMDDIQKQRHEARYQKWRKLGEKNGWHFYYDTFDKHGTAPEPRDYEQA